MAQHEIKLSLKVSDSEYIDIIKAQQSSGKRTVETYLLSLLTGSLSKPKVKAPKTTPEVPKPKKAKTPKPESAKDILAAAGFTLPSDDAPAAESAPAPSKLLG